jgi:hypothetical protein
MAGIANVLVLIGVVWLMFAILGISLFSDRLLYCNAVSPQDPRVFLYKSLKACQEAGGRFVSYPYNYDTVSDAMLTLFVVGSLNNWDQLMYQAVDSTGEDTGPVPD